MRKLRRRTVGHITVPKKTLVQPHELRVATILSWTGDDVEFIPVGRVQTPDIYYRGLKWEIKSPIGRSSRTIENNMRAAVRQSSNIIIDLGRIRLPEDKCLREIKRQGELMKGKHRILVITKTDRIIEL